MSDVVDGQLHLQQCDDGTGVTFEISSSAGLYSITLSEEQTKDVIDSLVDLAPSYFILPDDASHGDTVWCPTCGAQWQNVTPKEATWFASGY